MKKIIVFTHNPVRDPVTDDCLAVALRKKGHLVWRRRYLDSDKNMVVFVKPDIVVMPEIRCEYSLDYAKQCKAWGVQVVVRPCEVGISEESLLQISPEYRMAIFGENWPADNYIDLMLCWGPRMKKLFVKYGGMNPAKMKVVGGIAFDQFFLPPPGEKIARTKKKRVLFATGFAYADRNPQYVMPEAKPNDKIHAEMVACDSKARSAWLKIIKRFWAERGHDWEIWVKPHPGENEEVYKSVLRDVVSICPPLPPVRALKYVDIVVHSGSTMAFEAHLMSIPAVNLLNVCQDVIVAKTSPNVATFDELVRILDTTPLNKSNADKAITKRLIRDYYGKMDGKGSERAAEVISNLPANKPVVPDQWPKAKEWKYVTSGIVRGVENWTCIGCNTNYHVQGPREMVKCPCCGVANVKMPLPKS